MKYLKINAIVSIIALLLFNFAFIKTASCHPIIPYALDSFRIKDNIPFNRIEFIDGGNFNLREHKDKNLVVLFAWSYYFKDYRISLNMIRKLHSEYKNDSVIFLGINLDSNKERLEKLSAEYKIAFQHTYNPFLTFPAKLLGTFSLEENSIVIINKKGELSFCWAFINADDYRDVKKFLDNNLEKSR